jgi:osmoprotectant transport system substrate-binding protein
MIRRITELTMVVLWSAILVGCGSSSTTSSSNGGSSACPASGSASSTGSGTLKVGQKGFAEEQLLAQMTKLVLEKHGFTVDASFTAKDPILGQALESGTIDMYWQYTGTELQGPLGITGTLPGDLDKAYQQAKKLDEPRGICWNDEGKFNDTNGLAIRAADKSKYGTTLSQFSTYLSTHPSTVLCVASEFLTRPDGLPGLESTYGHYNIPGVKASSQSTYEPAIASGACEAGEVFTTDSGIAAKDLYVLQDDKKFFPPDNVGLLIKSSVQKAHPEIPAIMAPVIAKLDNATMIGLNKQVEIDNLKVADVAKTFLTSNSLL